MGGALADALYSQRPRVDTQVVDCASRPSDTIEKLTDIEDTNNLRYLEADFSEQDVERRSVGYVTSR